MAPVTPPASPKKSIGGAAVIGAVVGFILAAMAGVVVVIVASAGPGGPSHRGDCLREGSVYAAVAIFLILLAWFMVARVRGDGFEIRFLRGLTVAAAVFNVIPSPLSLSVAAYSTFTACG